MPRRLWEPHNRVFTLVVSAVLVLAFLVSGYALLSAGRDQNRINHSVCVAVNNINHVITQTLQRSKKNLPRLEYYRHHRRELREQLREVNHALKAFRPRTCR